MNTTINYNPTHSVEQIYFKFEEDFIEANVRCIPMIVRFKLDACGIKLQLAAWSRFTVAERNELVSRACTTREAVESYKTFLQELLVKRTGTTGKEIPIEDQPAWADTNNIVRALYEKANEFGWEISTEQWQRLSNLQRFALLKLCKPGHENKNFPKAMKEFKIVSNIQHRATG
jgi:hypothetical protein